MIKTKEETIKERSAMPIFGYGTFKLVGENKTLPIVKMGNSDIVMRAEDYGFITLNKKFVEVTS